MPKMKIKAVLFDLGRTLIDYDFDSPEEIFRKILVSEGISKPLQEVKNAFLNAEKEARTTDLYASFGKIKCEDYWHKWDALVLKQLEIENNELAESIHSKWIDFAGGKLYSEVSEVLDNLKKAGLKIGLISAGYESEIICILEKVGLEKKTFEIMIGADTIKKVKPEPDVFKYALAILNVKPEEALFVGDNIDVDYNGAKAVGIHALLIERKNNTTNNMLNIQRIKNLKEIFTFIK